MLGVYTGGFEHFITNIVRNERPLGSFLADHFLNEHSVLKFALHTEKVFFKRIFLFIIRAKDYGKCSTEFIALLLVVDSGSMALICGDCCRAE